MVKVITYGTYDLLHYGHIRLLERAKALGDYLIVGVTADDFDKTRGKINVQQSLMERVEAVRQTGVADEIIIEEYEGQKIDDILRYNVDIFTVGSDWQGKFDYLNEYCKVVYLERTQGISSTGIRTNRHEIRMGLIGESSSLNKIHNESSFVNGMKITAVYAENTAALCPELKKLVRSESGFDTFLQSVDAVYIMSHPTRHYQQVKRALELHRHVICELPLCMKPEECDEVFELAETNGCILIGGLKTAFSTAYSRLLLLVKSGKIGKVVSVDATCTSLREAVMLNSKDKEYIWNSVTAWGPIALLPVFQILGTEYISKHIISSFADYDKRIDTFTKIDFLYPDAVASIKVGKGVKSEGELVISGTNGYVYVPAPWWKTDYFELRFENPEENRRYYYQLDGEGIRYELVAFVRCIESGKKYHTIENTILKGISAIIADFEHERDMSVLGRKALSRQEGKGI